MAVGPQTVIIRVSYDREQGEFAPMATATRKRYTPEDLLKVSDRLMPELIDGQLVERESMGQEADAVGGRLISFLNIYASTTLPGLVNAGQGGFQIFPDDPKKVRIPDVAFTKRERIPSGRAAKGHSRIAPDLAVEIISPRDLAVALRRKIRDFLDAGIPLVWVICPETRDVEVFRADGSGALRKEGETLDGEHILPGFSCPITALFE